MKLYCFVENGAVVKGPTILPLEVEGLSDFELLNRGWYYAECIRPESFVDRYEIFLPISYDIQQYKVVCTFTKRNKTQDELNVQNLEKQQLIEADKQQRLEFANTFIQSDKYNTLTQEIKNQWITYKQTVTDTVTTDLGDAIWDVGFPPLPPTEISTVITPVVGGV